MATQKERAESTLESINALAQTDEVQAFAERSISSNLTEDIEPLLVNDIARNDFINTICKIAYTAVNRRTFQNPLAFLIGERMDMGDSYEEINIEIMEAQDFEVSSAAMAKLLTSMPPNTMSALHRVNRDVVYAVDISNARIRQAFTNYTNFNNFIEQVIKELYNSMYINQYKWTKGILGAAIVNKGITMESGLAMPTDHDTAADFVKKAKAYAKLFPFPSTQYNASERTAFSAPGDVYLFLSAQASAAVEVDVIMSAFNPGEAQVGSRTIIIDEIPDETYGTFAVLCDRNFIRINPQIMESGNFFNTFTFTTKHTIHSAEIYSYSPFANAVGFCTGSGYSKTKFDGTIS